MDPWTILVDLLGWTLLIFAALFLLLLSVNIVAYISRMKLVSLKEWIDILSACDIIIRLILLANLQDSEHAAVGRAYRYIRLMRMAGVKVDVPDELAKYLWIETDPGEWKDRDVYKG